MSLLPYQSYALSFSSSIPCLQLLDIKAHFAGDPSWQINMTLYRHLANGGVDKRIKDSILGYLPLSIEDPKVTADDEFLNTLADNMKKLKENDTLQKWANCLSFNIVLPVRASQRLLIFCSRERAHVCYSNNTYVLSSGVLSSVSC